VQPATSQQQCNKLVFLPLFCATWGVYLIILNLLLLLW